MKIPKILRFSFLALVLIVSMAGCKKTIENIQEDLFMDLVTNNIWLVSNFKEGSTDFTQDFAPYEFKFNRDGSVYGRKQGFPDAVGTWQGNREDQSISSAFPNGPSPLEKLNGRWLITKSTLSSVKSYRKEGSVTFYLDLVKK